MRLAGGFRSSSFTTASKTSGGSFAFARYQLGVRGPGTVATSSSDENDMDAVSSSNVVGIFVAVFLGSKKLLMECPCPFLPILLGGIFTG